MTDQSEWLRRKRAESKARSKAVDDFVKELIASGELKRLSKLSHRPDWEDEEREYIYGKGSL